MVYKFLTKQFALILIILGEFVAERVSSVYSAETNFRRSNIEIRSRRGNSCDRKADDRGQGLISTGNRKAGPSISWTCL